MAKQVKAGSPLVDSLRRTSDGRADRYAVFERYQGGYLRESSVYMSELLR